MVYTTTYMLLLRLELWTVFLRVTMAQVAREPKVVVIVADAVKGPTSPRSAIVVQNEERVKTYG